MTILFLDYYYGYLTNGIFRYKEQLRKAIMQFGPDVHWIEMLIQPKEVATLIYDKENSTIWIPNDISLGNSVSSGDVDLAIFLREHFSEENQVILHLNWFNHTPWAYVFRRFFPSGKIIFTKHCVAWRNQVNNDLSLFNAIYQSCESYQWLPYHLRLQIVYELFAFESADVIITVTQDAYKLLTESYGINRNKVRFIPNGVKHSNSEVISKSQLGFKEEDILIVYAGSISKPKGIDVLLNLFLRLQEQRNNKNLHLVVCGAGDMIRIQRQIPLSAIGTIHFIGHQDNVQLGKILSVADVAVVPSLVEQCSFAALEMLNIGVPTMISKIPGVGELIPISSDFYIPIEFINGIAKVDYDYAVNALISLLENQTIYQAQVKGQAKLLRNYSVENMLCKTLEAYKQTCDVATVVRNQGLVSVIMPCHNGEEFISEAISSVMAQSYPYFELIVVDDASTDDTIKVVSSFYEPRIKLLRSKTHRGISWALNYGISNAKGKYIARLDADDVMKPTRLHTQVCFLEEHNEYDIVGSNHITMNKSSFPISYVVYPQTNEEISLTRFFRNPFSHPSVMFRVELFNMLQYEKMNSHCEDYDLWMRLLRERKGFNIQEGLTYYRIHEHNVSSTHYDKQRDCSLELIYRELEFCHIEVTREEEMVIAAVVYGASVEFWKKYDDIFKCYLQKLGAMVGINMDNLALEYYKKAFINICSPTKTTSYAPPK